ncbi:hypothetical protein NHU_04164 [Rhodovulum sulfidophilum]|uniref:Uncharacterized protein n=1 Tax=Rhodovulum sulfidophilum TaxID=35806 RepID=A0A0D6B949_RHOSU|nr:hypothetical protein NHU_04164 [Rhodovulum sulfidophilum]
MADAVLSIRAVTDEPLYFSHSPASRSFSRFISALGAAIECERDIEGASAGDPAFDLWLRDAELAWEAATGACRTVLEMPLTRVSDVPLRNIARLIENALCSEDAEELACVRMSHAGHPDLYRCPGTDPVSRRVAGMLARAQTQLGEIADLAMLSELPSSRAFRDTAGRTPDAA